MTGILNPAARRALKLQLPPFGDSSAPTPSLCGWLFTVGVKKESKSDCSFIFVGSHLLGGEPIGNPHRASILIKELV